MMSNGKVKRNNNLGAIDAPGYRNGHPFHWGRGEALFVDFCADRDDAREVLRSQTAIPSFLFMLKKKPNQTQKPVAISFLI